MGSPLIDAELMWVDLLMKTNLVMYRLAQPQHYVIPETLLDSPMFTVGHMRGNSALSSVEVITNHTHNSCELDFPVFPAQA